MKWEGEFSSLRLPTGVLSGHIIVDKVEVNKVGYTSKAKITYTGMFRKGMVMEVEVEAKDKEMTIDLKGRVIKFKIDTQTDRMITGSYKVTKSTEGKLDSGQFYLQPEGSPKIKNPQDCCIS